MSRKKDRAYREAKKILDRPEGEPYGVMLDLIARAIRLETRRCLRAVQVWHRYRGRVGRYSILKTIEKDIKDGAR